MFKDVFDEFYTDVLDCVEYMTGERSIDDVQDIHDYDHDAYVLVQSER